MKVLLIWEENPENVKAFMIENPTAEQLQVLEEANGTMINSDEDTEAAMKISDALSERIDWCNPEGDPKWYCIWNDKNVEFPVQGPIDKVFKSGFCL